MALMGGKSLSSSNDNVRSALSANEVEAQSIADRLPDLLIEAMRISTTIAHGIHGRRRAGPGETFWQFRQYETTDSRTVIDWRRSASSDHLFVREREWEAAHTFWLWADLSSSMSFQSHLSQQSKRDRAIVLLLATAELLVRSGERVALLGLTRPTARRDAATRIAESIAEHLESPVLQSGLPPKEQLSRYSGVVVIGDFLDPAEEVNERIASLASGGVSGHILQVLDPAEETLPYEGRAEFLSPKGGERWVADRVESLRERYIEKLQRHKQAIAAQAQRLGWSHLVHHSDRSAAEPLLSLVVRLQNADAGGLSARAGGLA